MLFTDVAHALVKNGTHMTVGQRIEHGFAAAPIFNELAFFEQLQLMRNGRLGHAEQLRDVTETSRIQKAGTKFNPGGVGEQP
jgi:hypothetical protein